MALLVENGLVLQPDYSFAERSLAIDNKVITAVGPRERMRKSHKRYDRVDASGCLVLPGFVNAHTHLALGLIQGSGIGLPLFEMFDKVLFPAEAKLTDEHAYLGSLAAGLEMLHTGTTAVNNINAKWSKPVLKAMERLGLRGTMAIACKDRDAKTGDSLSARGLQENESLVRKLRDHELVSGMFGLANEYESTTELIKSVKRLAAEHRTGVHMHVAESKKECAFIYQRTGQSSVKYLYDLGVLNEHSLVAHAVNIGKQDIPILSKSRATVVHCPTVNLNLGSGVAPVADMLEAGVSMGIGVDHPVANMSNDVRRQLDIALALQQAQGKNITARQLMGMATNTRLYGYSTSALTPGSLADLVVVSMRDHIAPSGDLLLLEALFGGSPVLHSVINGELVMRDSHVLRLNEKNVLRKAQKASTRYSKV